MKTYIVTPLPAKPAFVPKTICITCETQNELDALSYLFYMTPIILAVNNQFGVDIDLGIWQI